MPLPVSNSCVVSVCMHPPSPLRAGFPLLSMFDRLVLGLDNAIGGHRLLSTFCWVHLGSAVAR